MMVSGWWFFNFMPTSTLIRQHFHVRKRPPHPHYVPIWLSITVMNSWIPISLNGLSSFDRVKVITDNNCHHLLWWPSCSRLSWKLLFIGFTDMIPKHMQQKKKYINWSSSKFKTCVSKNHHQESEKWPTECEEIFANYVSDKVQNI